MHINASNFKERIKEDMLEMETWGEATFNTSEDYYCDHLQLCSETMEDVINTTILYFLKLTDNKMPSITHKTLK
jgi:hypothetical protein